MPQTREHAAVLRGARRASAAWWRSRRPTWPTRTLALERGARAAARSAEAVAGLGARRRGARRAAGGARRRGRAAAAAARGRAAAPRGCTSTASFTLRGAGTVVTGTLWSGAIGARRRGRGAARAAGARACAGSRSTTSRSSAPPPGQRVALNLAGVGGDEVGARRRRRRGRRRPARRRYLLDAELRVRAGRRARARRRACRSTTARARRRRGWPELGGRFWQLRLEQPLVPAAGDRLVRAPDRAAGHARRRRGARPGARAGTARRATCWPG